MVILCEILPSFTLEEMHEDRKFVLKRSSQSLIEDAHISRKENPELAGK